MTDATEIPYEPPRREFADTLLAFRDFEMASAWGVRVEPDPLGPVNKIVSLRRGGRRVKSVLCPVPVGAKVQLVRDDGGYTVDELTGDRLTADAVIGAAVGAKATRSTGTAAR